MRGAFFLHFKSSKMSNKERTEMHIRQLLDSRQLGYTYNPEILNHYYNKNKGSQANAFTMALKIADMMIEQYKPGQDELTLIYEQYNP